MRHVSSGHRACNPWIRTGTNWPFTSTRGRLPGEKIRSLTRGATWSIANNNAGVGMVSLGAAVALAAGGVGSVVKGYSGSLADYPPTHRASSNQRSQKLSGRCCSRGSSDSALTKVVNHRGHRGARRTTWRARVVRVQAAGFSGTTAGRFGFAPELRNQLEHRAVAMTAAPEGCAVEVTALVHH